MDSSVYIGVLYYMWAPDHHTHMWFVLKLLSQCLKVQSCLEGVADDVFQRLETGLLRSFAIKFSMILKESCFLCLSSNLHGKWERIAYDTHLTLHWVKMC